MSEQRKFLLPTITIVLAVLLVAQTMFFRARSEEYETQLAEYKASHEKRMEEVKATITPMNIVNFVAKLVQNLRSRSETLFIRLTAVVTSLPAILERIRNTIIVRRNSRMFSPILMPVRNTVPSGSKSAVNAWSRDEKPRILSTRGK